ncbi:MAG TPA: hypothetical protein VMT20_21655 [Terriglobia bacterium]|nr:hypothetical protein [Terriglobia bacterium]
MNRRSNRSRLTLVLPSTALALLISAASLPAADNLPIGTFVSVEWGVTFSADKTYHVTQNGELVVEGTYSGSHDQAVFQDTGGKYACSASDGKYTWKLDGDSLSFAKVEDDCDGRIGVLTGGPLVRQAKAASDPQR